MRKKLWIWMALACSVLPVHAQFNTVVATADRYKVEVIAPGAGKTESEADNAAAALDCAAGDSIPASSDEARRKVWTERYLSVCYPLREIKVTSPYGYRKDPFTGKRRFHNGLDLHARGDEVLAMMDGVVVKVGQDKSSGKYVVLRHGSYTVSYCHLSRILVTKGRIVRPRETVGITGSTGRSTGEHLHVSCKLDGRNIDPAVVFDYIESMRKECVAALAGL